MVIPSFFKMHMSATDVAVYNQSGLPIHPLNRELRIGLIADPA